MQNFETVGLLAEEFAPMTHSTQHPACRVIPYASFGYSYLLLQLHNSAGAL